jgi:hypothetical protein
MTYQWIKAARRIGKRLAPQGNTDLPQGQEAEYQVICGVAGCVIKKTAIRRGSLVSKLESKYG